MKTNFLSLAQLGKILGKSRITIYNKVKQGKIHAIRIGRSYAVPIDNLDKIIGKELSDEQKKQIEEVVVKTVKEYGEVLKLLANE